MQATPPATPEATEQMPPEPPPELPDVEDQPSPTGDTVPEGARVPGRWSARHKPSQRLRDSIEQGLLANLSAVESDYVEGALSDALEEEEYRVQDSASEPPCLCR